MGRPRRRETPLTGRISDQAELNGVINVLYDLHVPIISVLTKGKM